MRRYAVIPTRDRPVELARCVSAIKDQVDQVLVIENSPLPSHEYWQESYLKDHERVFTLPYTIDPVSLSHLWNLGLTMCAAYEGIITGRVQGDPYMAAILNDDAVPHPDWMDRVCAAMERTGAPVGFMRPGPDTVLTSQHGFSVMTRVHGWAFVVRADLVTFDERFQWWCGDDDISAWARANGGIAVVDGAPVPNTLANSTTTGELLARTATDMQEFVDKWGCRPW